MSAPLAGADAWAKTDSFDLNSLLVLVNNKCFLPKSYVPDDFVKVKIVAGDNFQLAKGTTFNQTALKELKNMFIRGRERRSYRLYFRQRLQNYQNQKTVFARKLRSMKGRHGREEAFSKASEVVAYLGSSEHQTDLAVEVSTVKFNFLSDFLIEEFVQTR